MTKTDTTKPTSATIAALFTIEPTYASKHGTGHTCRTVQGYRLKGPVIAPAGNWYSSKRNAQAALNDMQLWATGDADISRVSAGMLEWLVRILGADGAPSCVHELAQRKTKAEADAQVKQDHKSERAELASRVRETLAAAGFTTSEINRVTVEVTR